VLLTPPTACSQYWPGGWRRFTSREQAHDLVRKPTRQGWITLAGTVDITGPATALAVAEARPVLVDPER
jgi:hypothetical protein